MYPSSRYVRVVSLVALWGACFMLVTGASEAAQSAKSSKKTTPLAAEPILEAKAIDVLKAASGRLAAAHTMHFTAVTSYESPSRLGPPLIYTTRSEVTVQRPDKLSVITSADGPSSEFYYDGKTMTAFEPGVNLVATAAAPATIDAALQAAYDTAAIYYPFSDLVVADPYGDIAGGLKHAFYIGQSKVVGGTTTDMLAYASDDVFVQVWIGAEDKLPRMMRAVYFRDPARLRHQLELSNWQLDVPVSADAFASAKVATAQPISFDRPDAKLPLGAARPGEPKAAKGKRAKSQ